MPNTAPLSRDLSTTVPAAAAAVAQDQSIGAAPFAGTVAAVAFTPEAAVAGVVTNNRTLRVVNKGQAGAGNTVVATLNLAAGVNAAAFDAKAIPLSGVAGATTVAEGDVLVWDEVVNGTGLASPGGLVQATVVRGV